MGKIKRGEICFDLEQIWSFESKFPFFEAYRVHSPLIVRVTCVCLHKRHLILYFYFNIIGFIALVYSL